MKIETATIARLRDALIQRGRRRTEVVSSAEEVLTREGLLSPAENEAIAQVSPMAEVMYLVMAADGRVADAEVDALRGAVRRLTGDLLQDGTVRVMLERFQARLDEEGHAARLADLASQLTGVEEAEGAFALAAAVALADDRVAPEESALMRELAGAFSISEERVRAILEQLDADRSASSSAS